jgi:hypothetical protein
MSSAFLLPHLLLPLCNWPRQPMHYNHFVSLRLYVDWRKNSQLAVYFSLVRHLIHHIFIVLLFIMTCATYASVRHKPNGFIGTPSSIFRFLHTVLHFIQNWYNALLLSPTYITITSAAALLMIRRTLRTWQLRSRYFHSLKLNFRNDNVFLKITATYTFLYCLLFLFPIYDTIWYVMV